MEMRIHLVEGERLGLQLRDPPRYIRSSFSLRPLPVRPIMYRRIARMASPAARGCPGLLLIPLRRDGDPHLYRPAQSWLLYLRGPDLRILYSPGCSLGYGTIMLMVVTHPPTVSMEKLLVFHEVRQIKAMARTLPQRCFPLIPVLEMERAGRVLSPYRMALEIYIRRYGVSGRNGPWRNSTIRLEVATYSVSLKCLNCVYHRS